MQKEYLTLAACSFEVLPDGGRIQLLPYGEFRAVDGRPHDVPAWFLTEENGHDVADLANQSRTQLVVDYEHQTLYKEQNGQPAPAAGWMRWVAFTPRGLFADVEWTDKAAALIRGREYRYVSAVFAYDTQGYVRKLFHAALTNFPALDGMDEVLAAASVRLFDGQGRGSGAAAEGGGFFEQQGVCMNDLLKQLLGLPDATEAELTAALSALAAAKPQGAVLSADVFAQLADKDGKIAALSAQQPDLTQFVPVQVVRDLQSQVAALSAGKLLPAQKAWAEDVLKQPNGLAFLSGFVENAQPVAALTGVQSAAAAADGLKTAALSAEEKAAAKMLGMTESEFAQVHYQEGK